MIGDLRVFISDEHIERAKRNGVNYFNLYNRIVNLGWDIEKAIIEPIKTKEDRIFTDEQLLRARENGISRQNLYNRIVVYGWDVERALTEPIRNVRKFRRI